MKPLLLAVGILVGILLSNAVMYKTSTVKHPINTGKAKISISILDTVTLNGHSWLAMRTSNNSSVPVHNPECRCLKPYKWYEYQLEVENEGYKVYQDGRLVDSSSWTENRLEDIITRDNI